MYLLNDGNVSDPNTNTGSYLPTDDGSSLTSVDAESFEAFSDASITGISHAVGRINHMVHNEILEALYSTAVRPELPVLNSMTKPERVKFESYVSNLVSESLHAAPQLLTMLKRRRIFKVRVEDLRFKDLVDHSKKILTDPRATDDDYRFVHIVTSAIVNAYSELTHIDSMNLINPSIPALNIQGLNQISSNKALGGALSRYLNQTLATNFHSLVHQDLIRDCCDSTGGNPELINDLNQLSQYHSTADRIETLKNSIGPVTTDVVSYDHFVQLEADKVSATERFRAADAALKPTIQTEINTIDANLGHYTPHLTAINELKALYAQNENFEAKLLELHQKCKISYDLATSIPFDTAGRQIFLTELRNKNTSSVLTLDADKFGVRLLKETYIERGVDPLSAQKIATLDYMTGRSREKLEATCGPKDPEVIKKAKTLEVDELLSSLSVDSAIAALPRLAPLQDILSNKKTLRELINNPVVTFKKLVMSQHVKSSDLAYLMSLLVPFVRGTKLECSDPTARIAELTAEIANLKLESRNNPALLHVNETKIAENKRAIQELKGSRHNRRNALFGYSDDIVMISSESRPKLMRILNAYNIFNKANIASKIEADPNIDPSRLSALISENSIDYNSQDAQKLNLQATGSKYFKSKTRGLLKAHAKTLFTGDRYNVDELLPNSGSLRKLLFKGVNGVVRAARNGIKSLNPIRHGFFHGALVGGSVFASTLFLGGLPVVPLLGAASPYVTSYLASMLGVGATAMAFKTHRGLKAKGYYNEIQNNILVKAGTGTVKFGLGGIAGAFSTIFNKGTYSSTYASLIRTVNEQRGLFPLLGHGISTIFKGGVGLPFNLLANSFKGGREKAKNSMKGKVLGGNNTPT